MREKQFRMVMNEEERELLFETAKARHLPAAYLIRELVRNEHARLFGAKKPSKKAGTK